MCVLKYIFKKELYQYVWRTFYKPALKRDVHPAPGLVDELVREEEQVNDFCSERYRTKNREAGTTFKGYDETEFYSGNLVLYSLVRQFMTGKKRSIFVSINQRIKKWSISH